VYRNRRKHLYSYNVDTSLYREQLCRGTGGNSHVDMLYLQVYTPNNNADMAITRNFFLGGGAAREFAYNLMVKQLRTLLIINV
jgi:hypothetical protein